MESRLGNLVVDTLFPRFCVSCKREGTLWCGACAETWAPSRGLAQCPFCLVKGSDRVCGHCRGQVYLDGISAFAPYGNPVVRKAFSVWKYDHDREIEPVIHRWLSSSAVRMAPPTAAFYACEVPLHERKRRQRGFDQAAVVAKWAGGFYGLPVESFLVRTRPTAPQALADARGRQVGELDGLFVVKEDAVIPEHVLLCDDVFTSGATMDAAARALKEAGAKTVWGWVIARGG